MNKYGLVTFEELEIRHVAVKDDIQMNVRRAHAVSSAVGKLSREKSTSRNRIEKQETEKLNSILTDGKRGAENGSH